MKKIGLMGCGVVANYGHLPAIASTPGLQLTAVFDPDLNRAQVAQKAFNAEMAFSDVEAFLSCGLDAVAITSPAPFHHQNVLDCAQHHLHVLCEKPLAMNEAQSLEMIDAMKRSNLLLVTGFDYRFSPVALRIRDLIHEGAIGEIRAARLVYLWGMHGKWSLDAGQPVENPRRQGRMLEGGPLVDCGVHQIDLARWWFGPHIKDWCVQAAWADEYESPDHLWLHLNHKAESGRRGVHTLVEMSYSYGHTVSEPVAQFLYEIVGTDGLIRYDRDARSFEMRTAQRTHTLEWAGEKNFAGMYAAFAHALETGDAGHLATGEDGLIATQIARQATDRAQERNAASK